MQNLVAFQVAITTTGTTQNFPNNFILTAVTITSASANSAITIGNSSSVTATTGYTLAPGASVTIQLPGGNTNEIWVLGTSGNTLSVVGS